MALKHELVRAITAFSVILSGNHKKPQKKFIKVFLAGILAAGSPRLSAIGAKIRGDGAEHTEAAYNVTETYLSRNLVRKNLDMSSILDGYHAEVAPILHANDGEGVNIAVDGTDYQKPHARPHRKRGMQGASNVYDGSKSKPDAKVIGMGFPGVTIQAETPLGLVIPLMHLLYSTTTKDPLFGEVLANDHTASLACIERVARHVGAKAWWSFDRGYGSHRFMDSLDKLNLRWLVRMGVGDRWVTTASGVEWHLDELAHSLTPTFSIRVMTTTQVLDIKMALAHVRLGVGKNRQQQVRTLLVGWINDAPTPFVLLASEELELNAETAGFMRTEYLRRWRIEESHRHNKDRHGFGGSVETIQVLRLVSLQRVILFWMLVQGFLALERRKGEPGMRCLLLTIAGRWGQGPADPRYLLTKKIGPVLATWLPKLYARLFPKQVMARKVLTEEEAATRELARLEREQRKEERKAVKREMEMAALRAKLRGV